MHLKEIKHLNFEVFKLNRAACFGGIGRDASFKIEAKLNAAKYTLARYNAFEKKDFTDLLKVQNTTFNFMKAYKFIHAINYTEIYIQQKKEYFLFSINTIILFKTSFKNAHVLLF